MKIITKNTVCAVLVLVAFVSGYFFNEYLWHRADQPILDELPGIDLRLMSEVLNKALAVYVDPQKIDSQKLTYGAISGMIKAIGDPYTVFFDPEEAKKFREDISGTFTGIGAQLGMKDGKIKIIAPIKGTPAEKAGVMAGDVIFEVDKKSTADLSVDEVVNLIRGEKGTKVELGLITKTGEVKYLEITRDEIKLPTVEVEIKETASGKKVALLTIYQFSETVLADFQKNANILLNSGAKGIILDLRNDPGGLLDQTDKIAGWFIKKGATILVEQDKDMNRTVHISEGPASLENIPTVILVNEGTASAAEILAGALRDNRQLPIIGETTFGKGLVQQVVDIEGGSSLKVTRAKWFTPNGELIQDIGIKPTIEVKLTEDDIANNVDPQYAKGLEELDKLIK
ncbi:MAG: S41 family peptidase [Candidatus Paceibacterota bacterium]